MRFVATATAALSLLLAADCRRLLTVVLTGDNQWTCWLNGDKTVGPLDKPNLYGWQDLKVISKWVDDGQYLLACTVTDYGVVGGFIASIYADGVLIAETNPGHGWKSLSTGVAPAAGWNDNLEFDDSKWTTVTSACPGYPAWASVTAAARVNGSMSNWLWGPTCTTIQNTVLFRLEGNTNDGKRNLVVSAIADDLMAVTAPGIKFNNTGSPFISLYVKNSRILPGQYVIAAAVTNFGGPGGFILSATLDGCPILTTDTSALTGWIFTDKQPAAGWDTQVDFDLTSWQSITKACPFIDGWGGVDVQLQNSGPNPSWIWGTDCAYAAKTYWFRALLTIADPRLPLTVVMAVDAPFQAYIDGQLFDQSALTYSQRLQAFTFTKQVYPGERIIAFKLTPSGSFVPSNGVIAAVYLSGRLIATTGNNRLWTTTQNAPNSDSGWYIDVYPQSPLGGWDSVFAVNPLGKSGWPSVEATVRANGADAQWISSMTGQPLTANAWFRLVVDAQTTTPTVVYPIVTTTKTQTSTLFTSQTYCPTGPIASIN
jgi:hypothetical protein